jgi:hypothetical protein
MFRGRFAMNDPCPHCGLIFQREEGYFLGAMYVSTAFSIALTLPIYVMALVLIPGHNVLLATAVTLLAYIPLIPAVFRYSRVIWIYLDRAVCPSNFSAAEFEKLRESERDDVQAHDSY